MWNKIEKLIMFFFVAIIFFAICSFDCNSSPEKPDESTNSRLSAIESRLDKAEKSIDDLQEYSTWIETNSFLERDTLRKAINKLLDVDTLQLALFDLELSHLRDVHETDHNALLNSITALRASVLPQKGHISLTSMDSAGVRLYSYEIIEGTVYRTITIQWDANTESDLAGYKIYLMSIGSSEIIIAGKELTQLRLPRLMRFEEYTIRMSAFDTSFNESAFSLPLVIKKERDSFIERRRDL